MNAIQGKAGSLREHLISCNPEVWDQVVRNDLQGAACWDWSKEKMRHLSFKAFNYRPIVGSCESMGMFDLPDADRSEPPNGNMAWAGLPPERLNRKGGIILKDRNQVELACGLNRAMANWLGRSYQPRTSHEREMYGSILVERAAQTGDVKEMQEIFSTYSFCADDKHYLPALRTAAHREDRVFANALWQRIGTGLVEEAYAKCKLDEVTPEDKEEISKLIGVGLPVPAAYATRAALWAAEALAQRKPRSRKGVLAQPVRAKS
jgi:hypothetical protein